MDKSFNMTYSTSISNMCEVNSSFDSGILRICYPGENRNGSFISKADLERAIPTLYNCPIVCHYTREDDSLGGHDMELVSDDNYGLRLVNLTQPVGVIPESAKVFFENVVEEDGTEHEYLCAEALIWKRQEAYAKIKSDGVTSHSMEISVKSGKKNEDGLYHIEDFEFTAFALIGVEPCFEGSSITMFSTADAKSQLAEMMNDLKELHIASSNKAFTVDASINETTSTPSNEVDSVENNTSEMKGGENILDEKNELLKKYNIAADDLELNIEELSVEDLEKALQEFAANKDGVSENSENEISVDAGGENEDSSNAVSEDNDPAMTEGNNFDLEGNFRNELSRVLESVEIQREDYVSCRYWFVDYDHDANEVYFVDTEDYLLYGASYEVNGDDIIINYESKKRMKYTIVPHESGDVRFEHIHDVFCSEMKNIQSKMSDLSSKLNEAEDELIPLREFKASIAKKEKEDLLGSFSDLEGEAKFEEIKESANDMDMEEIEEKCFALRGRLSTNNSKAEKQAAPKLAVARDIDVQDNESEEPYHGAFKRFGF